MSADKETICLFCKKNKCICIDSTHTMTLGGLTLCVQKRYAWCKKNMHGESAPIGESAHRLRHEHDDVLPQMGESWERVTFRESDGELKSWDEGEVSDD